ncbi:MAG TPA: glycosyltransferase family 4 protein [Candidatus Omnitrophota bacterium]|nr:glycosyltransferase family 4 protein [Candidatus Omnitrophota bacterium]
MKILAISEDKWDDFAGTSVVVRNLCVHLSRLGNDVLVVLPSLPKNHREIESEHLSFFGILETLHVDMGSGMLYPWRKQKVLRGISDLCARFRPDAVHVMCGYRLAKTMNLISAAVPKVWTIHNLPAKEWIIDWGVRKRFGKNILDFFRKTICLVTNRQRFLKCVFDKIVCVSQSTYDGVRGMGVPAGKMVVINNGVDRSLFRPAAQQGAGRIFPDKCYPVLLSIASFVPGKGQRRFLRVLPDLLADYPHLLYCNVGRILDMEYYDALCAYASRHRLEGHVLFLQSLPFEKLPEYYQACDLYVQFSKHEGFGIPALEALSCGKRIVVTQTGAFAQLVNETGGGEVLDEVSGASVLRALKKTLLPETDDAVAKRVAYLGRNYDWNVIAKKNLEVYARLLER